MKRCLYVSVAVMAASMPAMAAGQYFPRYGNDQGGLVEFHVGGFYVRSFDLEELTVYDCKKLGSLTKTIHWGQCVGGDKFLFTLDPKHPETLKIGDVIYRECGKLWDKCQP